MNYVIVISGSYLISGISLLAVVLLGWATCGVTFDRDRLLRAWSWGALAVVTLAFLTVAL